MALLERLTAPGPKRVLALDGGGVRGIVALGFLARLERLLRERHGRPDLRLCEYFDLIGGTSTGSIIAAGLAVGYSVKDLRDRYLALSRDIFGAKTSWFGRLRARFEAEPLEEGLRAALGECTLGDEAIRTGVCIVTKRADTGSTWPLLNHPRGKYYEQNRHIPLWKAVRASTAAPTVFVPETIDVGGGETGAFVDGAVSMALNPSLLLFLAATLRGFPFRWKTGAHDLLLVSVGTGYWRAQRTVEDVVDDKIWGALIQVPSMLMTDASLLAQLMLQYLSHSETPSEIDSEVGDLKDDLLTPEPALTYLRYNVALEAEGLAALGLEPKDAVALREMTAAENVEKLAEIGDRAAEHQIAPSHFPAAFDL